MNASEQQEIRLLFDDYLQMYASRDDRLTTHFSDDFSGFTGGGDFLVKGRDEWVAIMGGKEAAREILAIDPNARLIVSSGYSNDPIISDFTAYGFSGAIAKPYGIGELAYVLRA